MQMHTITITQTHTDFTRTPRAERMGCSPERSERCVRDAVVTGQDDRSPGYSVIQWSIFMLRSAKWGRSGGLTEYIPHLHHESSAAYYSCPAQGGRGGMLLFRAIGCVYVRACLHCSVWVHANFCARYLPKAQNEGMDTAYVTGCRLFNEKMDGRWHSLGTFFPQHLSFSTDLHLDRLSRLQVDTETSADHVYSLQI